ncbi:glycosyltransferase family 4 protein [Clostridium beijerinckii]|uniref:Glycosyltransferase family 4 protein n=1 Tax=Clostridium beijerinckii TaxID=1520 RepID=A0A7X9XPC6_CLOBE|nr:glycosyltransferase family 4 protein [Clostridium beijerinckii]NMF04831.1 glycosyltransferase family 4 protein [Clostridium beijerinckii]
MNILIVNAFYYPNMQGGTEQSVKLLAEGLKKKGHEVVVLTGDNSEINEENGVKIIRFNLKTSKDSLLKKVSRKILEFNNIVISNKLNSIIDEIKPDIIHTNNLFYISTIIWKIAKEKDIKVVHTLRDYWGVCPKTTLLNSSGNICVKGKAICNIHRYNYKLNTKYVDIVTSPSKFTLDLHKKNNMFENARKIVIPNAIDFDISNREKLLHERLERNDNNITFLFIGTLDTHKGVEFLIESFKQVKLDNIRLNICGDGPLKKYVKESTKIDKRINYLGKVLKDKKEEVLVSSDVMVVPSIWYEPFGRVVIEGYKYALPVIACKIGGIEELLNEEISIGINVNDENDLGNAILKLSDRVTVKKYMNNTGKYLAQYDINKQIDSFINIYKE